MSEQPAAWEYTLTPSESERWREGDVDERRELLEEMGPWLVSQAREHGCNSFTISDVDGRVIAEGTWGFGNTGDGQGALRPFDPDEYPTQNRRN